MKPNYKQAGISLRPYPNPQDTVYNPLVPYWGAISGGLQVGKIIELRGFVPRAADVFQINLVAGQDNGPNRLADRILHLSIRFKEHVVVRNTLTRNEWKDEERDNKFPFQVGKQFMLMILVDNEGFRVAVNSEHVWDFRHRLPFSLATMLYIDGVVKLEEIRYLMTPTATTVPSAKTTTENKIAHMLEPVISPRVPYFYPFHEGVKPGTMIYLSGRPITNASRFTINLQCDVSPYPPPGDIAFHFDARFFNSTVVRNTHVNKAWGREETQSPFFPFRCGVFFDMIIRIDSDKFMVALDGQHFIEYYHRIFPLTKINGMSIEDDIVITSIRIAAC